MLYGVSPFIFSQQLGFRQGASKRDKGVYMEYMTDGERACNTAENSIPQSIAQTAIDLGLKPVMELTSMIMAVHHYRAGECVGYGGTWQAPRDSTIGVVAIGYGDGYPRHIASNTPVGIHGERAPIVGRISMDMLTIDLTDCQHTVSLGERVELWGSMIPIETIAQAAGTIPYELMCQITSRVNRIS